MPKSGDERRYEALKELYGESNINLQNMQRLWDAGDAGKGNWISDSKKHEKYLSEGSILIVGCGIGGQVWGWRQIGREAMGIEINEWAVKHAIVDGIVCGDLAKTPFENKAFDNLLVFDVMEHIPLDFLDEAIQECERITKKVVLFRIPFYPSQPSYSYFLNSGIIREHMHNRHPIFWKNRLKKSFGNWEETTEEIGTDWTLYRYEVK